MARADNYRDLRARLQFALLRDAERLAAAILPDGKLSGREWTGHGPDGAKWGVVVRGPKLGRWQNFGDGSGGTQLLSLIREALCGGDWRKATEWAAEFVGGETDLARPVTPIARQPDADRKDAERRREIGKKTWLTAEPFAWTGPCGQYLEGRGLYREYFRRAPNALRFCPDCWNVERGIGLPAMIGTVIDPISRQHVALHRTWLERRDGDGWRKARLENAKMTLGPVRGGIIPLTRGESNKPWGKAPADGLLLAEGIENALTVAAEYPELRAAAYVSAGNLLALDLPECFERIMLVEDRDGHNESVIDARLATMAHWTREGRIVERWVPPEGFKDANDYLQRRSDVHA